MEFARFIGIWKGIHSVEAWLGSEKPCFYHEKNTILESIGFIVIFVKGFTLEFMRFRGI